MNKITFTANRKDNGVEVSGYYICLHQNDDSDLHIIVDEHGVYHPIDAETLVNDAVEPNTVTLRKDVKTYRAENFVIYDIDFLLENLAREIFKLYQTGKEFNKPAFDINEIRKMFVDYEQCEECTNPYTWGHICGKCGACGRKFDDNGVMITDDSLVR